MKFPPSEFWSFSTEFYQYPEIEQACLSLQNQHQADVNILLYCCWTGYKQIQLADNDIQKLITISQPWQSNILSHLRAARHTLKTSQVIIAEDLREETRKNICEMELNAEHMAQLALEKAINLKKKSPSKNLSTADCCRNNLTLYCNRLELKASTMEIDTIIQSILSSTQETASRAASN